MKTRIIADSTNDLLPHIKNRIHTVPLTVHFGNEEFIDGITMSHKEFYEKLTESEFFPSTSQAPPSAFAIEYEKVKKAGENALVITVSSELSGTYQSAVIAAEDYENIYIVDGSTVAIGGGILIERALQLLNSGLEAKEIADILEEEKKKINVIAAVDTLEYLKRGGRITKTSAFAGTMLNIKPILSIYNGEIKMLKKVRGTTKANKALIEEIEKLGIIDYTKPVLLGYTGTSDEFINKFIDDSSSFWKKDIPYTAIGSVIGTHAGPNAVAAAFFIK